jgi:hypothetical protein
MKIIQVPMVQYDCGCIEPISKDGLRARSCPHGKSARKDNDTWWVDFYDFYTHKTLSFKHS